MIFLLDLSLHRILSSFKMFAQEVSPDLDGIPSCNSVYPPSFSLRVSCFMDGVVVMPKVPIVDAVHSITPQTLSPEEFP